MSAGKLVAFSDVDRVLGYPRATGLFDQAAQVLAALRRAGVPLVLCSSKTRAEIEEIQRELGISDPFVSERGGAAFIPMQYFDFAVPGAREVAGYLAVEFGLPYAIVVETLHRTAHRLAIEIVGFNGMSVDEVARDCHLPLPQARLAMLREYGEHFRVLGSADQARPRLFKALASLGLRCEPGTLFDHVGAPVRAGTGLKFLCSLYEQAHGTLLTLGLADATADASILPLVDHAVPVCDERHATGQVDVVGWAEAIVDGVEVLRRHASRRPERRGEYG